MSIESEDMLEDALRSDFPTPDAQGRIRRRLLAAGIAVGNGVATTAAASGAGAGAAATATAAKVAGLSWGLKVGLVAVLAIPTVGMWLDRRAEQELAAHTAAVTPARVVEGKPQPVAPATVAARPTPELETQDLAVTPDRMSPRVAKATVVEAVPPSPTPPTNAHPSQGDFAAPEPPARAPQVGSTLAEETRLLDSAFAELAAGHRARAAELIHEHEARFPAGLLQKERERAKTRLSEMSRGE